MREKLLTTREVFAGRFLTVQVDEVEAADGHIGTRELVRTRGAAAIVCVQDSELVLTRQYRHAVADVLLEIPAGIVEDGEDPADTVGRELVEEVGLRPRRVEHLATYLASPGFTDHSVAIFFTDDVEQAERAPDPGEVIEIERRPLADISTLLSSGEVRDAKTLLGLSLVAARLGLA